MVMAGAAGQRVEKGAVPRASFARPRCFDHIIVDCSYIGAGLKPEIGVREAKARLSEMLERVEAGERC
jgi:hypothetical protein